LPTSKSSPLPVILGIGGAVVLLIVAGVALSGGRRPPAAAPRPAPAPAVGKDRDVRDTGLIMFVCSNAGTHEDREVVLESGCPACGKRSSYFWDAALDGYRCFACSAEYPKERIQCPACGRRPSKTRLKHK
jgi:hypothetical protein